MALFSYIQLNSAKQRYTVYYYSYTSLYTIHPPQHPSACAVHETQKSVAMPVTKRRSMPWALSRSSSSVLWILACCP